MLKTNNTIQAAWIALGSLFSFGFSIVSSAILSRYFNKADYGTYKQVLYVYGTLQTVFTLGLPKAFSYFLPRVQPTQARNLIRKLTRLFFILGSIFSILLFVFSPQIADFMKNPDLKQALRVFAIVPTLMLPTMGLEGILATYKKTKFMAVYTIITRVLMLLCVALPVMIWNFGYIEAIMGFVVASMVDFALALYLKYMPVKNQGKERCDITYKEVFHFSLPVLYASLWGVIIASADQFFISRYFGSEVFAEFSNGSMDLPFIGMITGACASVLSPIFSKMNYEKVDPQKEIFPLWKNVFEKTVKLIYPILIYCWIFGDVLMVLLYGQKYECSTIYFRIKTIANFFTIIAVAPLLINIGKVKLYANVHLVHAIVLVTLELLSIKIISSPYAISVISLVCRVLNIFFLLAASAKIFNMKLIQLFPTKLIMLITIPSVLLLGAEHFLLINVLDCSNILSLCISFVSYMILFLFYSKCVNIDYINVVKPLIGKKRN